MDLGRRVLQQQEAVYEKEEDQYAEEIEYLETLPEAFKEGTWMWEDLEWIVRWKMTGLPFVDKAVVASSPSEKITHLTEISGVAERMGSAFLLFMNPDRFTVLDWKAWSVLHESGYLPDEMPDDPAVEDYLLYLGACWAIANEYDVSLRTLDMALWALGGDE